MEDFCCRMRPLMEDFIIRMLLLQLAIPNLVSQLKSDWVSLVVSWNKPQKQRPIEILKSRKIVARKCYYCVSNVLERFRMPQFGKWQDIEVRQKGQERTILHQPSLYEINGSKIICWINICLMELLINYCFHWRQHSVVITENFSIAFHFITQIMW